MAWEDNQFIVQYSPMGTTIILSDTHLGKESDSEEERRAKELSLRNIADEIRSVRPKTVVLLGDIWHHRNGRLGDCSDGLAQAQIEPLALEWLSQNFEIVGIAGNTDPEWTRYWNRQLRVFRRRIHELLLDRGETGNLTVSKGGLVHITPNTGEGGGDALFTHGHVFLPNNLRVNLRALFTGNPEGGRVYGSRIQKALSPDKGFLEDISSQHGSHRLHYLLSRVLRLFGPLSQRMKHVYAGLHLSALSEAGRIVQTEVEHPVHSLFMGHTHVPSQHTEDGRTIVNTGTAGAEKSDVATFAEVDEQGKIRLMQSWHPDQRHKVVPFSIEV